MDISSCHLILLFLLLRNRFSFFLFNILQVIIYITHFTRVILYIIWQTTFLDQVPTWFSPTDAAAAEAFFEGRARVPWPLWWGPLGAWSFFTVCVFIASLSVIAVLQRQWIANERLSFPFAQIPLEIDIRPQSGRRGSSLPPEAAKPEGADQSASPPALRAPLRRLRETTPSPKRRWLAAGGSASSTSYHLGLLWKKLK